MPGRPLPDPTLVAASPNGRMRVVHWEADYLLQRLVNDEWQTLTIFERPATEKTVAKRRQAIQAIRARILAGEEVRDDRSNRIIRWNGTDLD